MERRKHGHGGNTLFRRMLMFLLAILLFQTGIYLAVFFGGGIIKEAEQNAFDIFQERTANRKRDLESNMLQRWSNVGAGRSELMAAVEWALADSGASAADLNTDWDLCQKVLDRAAPSLVAALRLAGVTGVFAILNCPSGEGDYPGVYIRDYSPETYVSSNADLLLIRGLPQVARDLSIPMDSYWSAFFRFGGKSERSSYFYFHPLDAVAAAAREERQKNIFYHWSESFTLSPADRPVIAYTIPLVWKDGTILGAMGVDLTQDYLVSQLNYRELGGNRSGAYFLGKSTDGGQTYTTVCTSGPMFSAYLGQTERLTVQPDKEHSGIFLLPDAAVYTGERVYGAVQPLKLYNSNTPFENDQWALIGIQGEDHLLQFSRRMNIMVLITAAGSLALGLLCTFLAAQSFTRPISALVGDLRRSDPNRAIRLRRVNITEVDALSDSIETLSNAAVETASRISHIISMSHVPIGVFEYRENTDTVFCGKNLFRLLGWPERPEEDQILPKDEFFARLYAITGERNFEAERERIYRIDCDGHERWVQFFRRWEETVSLGVFLDVTADMAARQRIEYERDYDVLTGLYNRRAFDREVEALFAAAGEKPLDTAAMLMLDLDNLKYINDSSGHDYGDCYLQALARCLRYFEGPHAVIGRRSGDEFNVFLYGYDGEAALRRAMANFWGQLGETTSPLPGGGVIRVRASGGLAWYGRDADQYTELLRMADFTMYGVKHTVKGVLREFNKKEYDREAILIQGQDDLNRTLESRMVRYALQPIVSTADGSVYGYEFLMRPMLKRFSNLDDLFRLARAESKLQQIEELTWSEAMGHFAFLARTGQIPADTRAFINSISSQCISNQLLEELEKLYRDVLSRVVIELTESEEINRKFLEVKRARIRIWGGALALDDYGTGYSTDSALVDLAPDIVKVDAGLIHGIDRDGDRLAVVRNLVGYAKSRGILVLAEGVETYEEMETLISCGMDYLQGYYLAYPGFTVPQVSPAVVGEIQALYQKYHPQLQLI